jgi:hypothetical protein
MTTKPIIWLAGVAIVMACVAGTAQASNPVPPALAAKRAQAARVLNEIAAIDESLNTV